MSSKAQFDEIIGSLKEDLKDLAGDFIDESRDELADEVTSFLEQNRNDLEEWTRLLAEGKITRGEYTYLVEGMRDMAEMRLLKQKGLSQIRIDRFRNKVFNLLLDTVFNLIPG